MSSIFVGDPPDRAFERLYERYVREVYRYVLAMVRNPAEAEDVTQTTFLNAYRALQAGAEPRAPHNWLIAIAHNTCRSSVRRSMRRPHEVPLGEEQLAAAEPDRTNIRELLRAVARLPFNQRSALTMRELEGRTYPEIAETLGVTVPAVEALIARARRTLRTQVGTLRGLAALLVPRSLRKLSENGDAAAGGALGAGVAAKTAALVLVGIAGFASVETGALRQARTAPPTPVQQGALPSSFAVVPPSLAPTPRARAASPQPQGASPLYSRGAARPGEESVAGAASGPVHQATAGPGAAATAQGAVSGGGSAQAGDPAGGVQQTASGAVATVAATVPQTPVVETVPVPAATVPVATPELPPAPAPTVPVPTPELPPVTVPPPPEPPPLP